MPLFSKPKGGNAEQDVRPENRNGGEEGERSQGERPQGERPPDEHTRLLRSRVSSNPDFLAPDDPAVSPYNLFSIRMLRYLTLFFAALSFLWWVILLVSVFATPPGFHAKGSSFFAFGYASLTLANMLCTLLFFGVPSKAARALGVVVAAFLALDTILLLSVQRTRYEEGWVGIASVLWALLMSFWAIVTDRTVQWGKAEEEERLTGRAETRKTLTEWLEVLLSTAGYSVMVVAVALMTLTIILRALDARVAPPGKLYWVDSGKYRIHLYCHGNKTDQNGKAATTVLFEGGERPVEHGLWDFADNAVKNGSISRYCFADRPGLAWSDAAPSPSSAGFVVDALSEALAEAGEAGPWVLASAGIGSLYSRVFSARHGHDVGGLLLMDPLHEDLLGPGAAPGRGFWLWLRGAVSPLGLDRIPGAVFRGRTSRDRIYGRSASQTGKSLFAKLQESLVLNSFTKRDVDSSRQIQDKDTPLVVISSGRKVKGSDRWASKQRDLTRLTEKLRHWDVVNGAPHEVWRTLEGRETIEKRLKQMV
ncbi:integral membrane [Trichoderma cornu-damae]|uniref:Integral membrane n=1 Tax=Trichoderma cornu-damae TaxID=654480 RepID=A0A9P8QL54_9HYPO|nr:integral membrane [Trichoderma cornu-damae]